ncbi:protein-L-isoaspartate(D-aspartate) O-methyltransferase [Nitrospira sp. Nam74]
MSRATLLLLVQLVCGACWVVESSAPSFTDLPLDLRRDHMVKEQIIERGIGDRAVIQAMRRVPRHRFVPEESLPLAYADRPLPIGYGQTVSQPYIVAFMTEALELKPGDHVLEIGTGSGYQTAILAEIAAQVFTIEIVEALAEEAAATLAELGYTNVHTRVGDGFGGWPEAGPFQAVIVTAASLDIPHALLEQLASGGRLLLPVGRAEQHLVLYRRTADGYTRSDLGRVRFVPLVDPDGLPR